MEENMVNESYEDTAGWYVPAASTDEEESYEGIKGGLLGDTTVTGGVLLDMDTTESGDINVADLDVGKEEESEETVIEDVTSVNYGERTAGEPNERTENWGD